jgi:hypothetical protein
MKSRSARSNESGFNGKMHSRIQIPRRPRIRIPTDMAETKTSFSLCITCENVFPGVQDALDTLRYLLANEGAGLAGDHRGAVFRTVYWRTRTLTDHPMTQSDAWPLLQRRAREDGFRTAVRNHNFRATGISAYFDNGGSLRTPGLWPLTRVLAPPRFTIERTTRSRSTRSKDRNLKVPLEHVGVFSQRRMVETCARFE